MAAAVGGWPDVVQARAEEWRTEDGWRGFLKVAYIGFLHRI